MFDYLGLGQKLAQIVTNTLSENVPTRFPNIHKILKWHQNIIDKNKKKIALRRG